MLLADYITQVRTYLADITSAKYTDAMITAGIRQALAEYNWACPQMNGSEITLASTARDIVLTSLSGSAIGLQNILEVYYPYTTGEVVHNVVENYYQYMTSGSVALNMQTNDMVSGRKIYVRYAANNTIDDLDSATVTTIRGEHDFVIVIGGAGHSAKIRASLVSESYATNTEDMKRLDKYGGELLGSFRQQLEHVRQESVSTRGPYSKINWVLDQWDNSE